MPEEMGLRSDCGRWPLVVTVLVWHYYHLLLFLWPLGQQAWGLSALRHCNCILKFYTHKIAQCHKCAKSAVTERMVLALDLEGVHDVKLHHPSSSVATSNQWCWSGVRGNINKLLLIVVMCCILLLHILWSGLQVSQIGFCLTASISLWFC